MHALWDDVEKDEWIAVTDDDDDDDADNSVSTPDVLVSLISRCGEDHLLRALTHRSCLLGSWIFLALSLASRNLSISRNAYITSDLGHAVMLLP